MTAEGYVEVVKRYPLWSSIPVEERITEDDINRYYSRFAGSPGGSPDWPYRVREIDLLNNPRCIVATKRNQLGNRWGPCAQAVKPGADLCLVHGGPSARTTGSAAGQTRRELEAEIARLRAQLGPSA